MFRAVGIEEEMRQLATEGAALPYLLTLLTSAAFLAFGLYGLSGAGKLRRLPLLRSGLVAITAIFLFRAEWGIGSLREGDDAQVAFAVVALLIGLCYACGAVAQREPRPGELRTASSAHDGAASPTA